MILTIFSTKKGLLLPLLALPMAAAFWFLGAEKNVGADANNGTGEAANNVEKTVSPEAVDLALRRVGDRLLRAAGDSTSQISAVERAGEGVFRLRLEAAFDYEKLPALLNESLELHGVRAAYAVAVRRCFDETMAVELGYHQADFLDSLPVPCGGRERQPGCRDIEVKFEKGTGEKAAETNPGRAFLIEKAGLLAAFLGFLGLGWFFFKPKKAEPKAISEPFEPEKSATDWLVFGQSKLDADGQMLVLPGGERQKLTRLEAKLLRLFATNADRLLSRDELIEKVWADEGVLVSRSVDMFVSRLRKKLAADGSVRLAAVHGVGYRLETKRPD